MTSWRLRSMLSVLSVALLGGGGGARADERRDLESYRASAEIFATAVAAERRSLFDEARDGYAQAIARDPDFVEAILNLARLEIARGELAAAEAGIERAERIRSDYPKVAATRGLLAMARGDLAGALDAFSRAHRLAPEDAEVAVNLSAVLIQRGRPDEARKILETLLRVHPDQCEAFYNLALANDLSGRTDAAIFAYRRFLGLAALDDLARVDVQRRLEAIAASKNGRKTDDGG